MPWCCPWMRRRRSRPWSAPRPARPCSRDSPATQTQSETPPAGVPGFPGHPGCRDPGRDPGARDSGQLRHPQDRRKYTPGLETHPHWHFHFTPTSSSWMHAVEGLFAKLARGLACNAATSPPCRNWWIPCTHTWRPTTGYGARPFVWRKDPEEIIAARKRGYHKLETIH